MSLPVSLDGLAIVRGSSSACNVGKVLAGNGDFVVCGYRRKCI